MRNSGAGPLPFEMPEAFWRAPKCLESHEPSPAGREIFIRILIDLKGEDLGDDVLPWKTWCLGLVQTSVPGAP